jgi:hypothetical protein
VQEFLDPDTYFRMNPRGDAFNVELDETNLEKIQGMAQGSALWADDNIGRISQLCKILNPSSLDIPVGSAAAAAVVANE